MRLKFFRGNVFVANLPPELSDDELAEAFDSYGIVLSAHVARDPATGDRLRYGFVDIATERAAQRAAAPNLRPRRAPLRLTPRRSDDDATGDGFDAYPTVRRQPTFQVERRTLPR